MDLSMIFDIEKGGLATTIKQYTNDNYVISYCEKLEKLVYPNDETLIKILLRKLLSWYDEGNIDNIIKSEYVLSKQAHIKSYGVLKAFVKELGINYEPPEKTAVREDLENDVDPFVRAQELFSMDFE